MKDKFQIIISIKQIKKNPERKHFHFKRVTANLTDDFKTSS